MEIKPLWPTMFGSGKFEVSGLFEHIITHYDLDKVTEVDGSSIFKDNSKVMKEFKKVVFDKFDEYLFNTIGKNISDYRSFEMKSWITGQGKNYSMAKHNHAGSQLSGVFYIMAENQKSGGDIVFTDPRSNSNRGYDDWFHPMFENYKHTPESGDYMIFPSFAYHHVNPYYSNMRVCVPVDLYLHRS